MHLYLLGAQSTANAAMSTPCRCGRVLRQHAFETGTFLQIDEVALIVTPKSALPADMIRGSPELCFQGAKRTRSSHA